MDILYMTGSLLRDLKTNRMRRLLSILGVVIGTAAVIASLAVVEGGQHELRRNLEKLGVNMVFLEDRYRPEIMPVSLHEQDGMAGVDLAGQARAGEDSEEIIRDKDKNRQAEMLTGRDSDAIVPMSGVLRMSDVSYLRRRFSGAERIEPVTMTWLEVAPVGGRAIGVSVEGGTAGGAEIRNLQAAAGRYICPTDVECARKVCVLGDGIARALFGTADVVGRRISMLGARWHVVGVLAPKGTMMRFDYDQLIVAPITSLHKRIGMEAVNALLIRARGAEEALAIRGELRDEVLSRLQGRNDEEIRIFCQDELVAQNDRTLTIFRILTISVAAFSLLVSGVGIMNIMLVSVRERTREIGVWKAVGARDRDVLFYFLAESVLTCTLGGGIGVVLGLVLASRAAGFASGAIAEIPDWTPVFSPVFFILSIGSSVIVGLVSGLFPAIIAARLEPTEALSYE